MSREIGIGILLSAAVSDSTSRTARTAADLTRQIIGFRFSRRDEKDADLAGLDYMVRAGYDPNGDMIQTEWLRLCRFSKVGRKNAQSNSFPHTRIPKTEWHI
ncbi:MAG: hypothetical protein ACYSYL_20660 [Planctomycetota bacterium]